MPSVCGELGSKSAAAEDLPCSSGEVEAPPKDPSKIAEGLKLLSEGKRCLLCGNLPDASRCLADACDSLSEQCGQFGEECSDAYLSYGKTLLELARMEPGVIGVALEGAESALLNNAEQDGDDDGEPGAKAAESEEAGGPEIVEAKEPVGNQFESPSKLTEEERDTIHELVEGAFEENASFLEQLAAAASKKLMSVVNGDGDQCAGGAAAAETKDTAKTATSKDSQDEDANGECEESEAAEDDDEGDENEEETAEEHEPAEVNNLQLAWENIDLARLIYEKGGNELKVADCRMLLAEISMEDEEFARAIEDLDLCLQIRKKLLPADSRLIAESYYQMAVAHSNCENYQTSAECFGQCMEVLEKRRELLKQQCDAAEDTTSSDIIAEIEEIEALLLDLKDRISDANASGAQVAVHGKEIDDVTKSPMKNGCATSSTSNGFIDAGKHADGAVKTDDISHLVRKPIKRKPETESECPDATKKVKAANAEPITVQNVDHTEEGPITVQTVHLTENKVDSSTEKTAICTAKADADVLMTATESIVSVSGDSLFVGSDSTTDPSADVVMVSATSGEPPAEPVSMISNEAVVADDVVMVTSTETETRADDVMPTSAETETRADDVMATSTETETRADDVMATSTETETRADDVIATSTETETPADVVLVTSNDAAPPTDVAMVTTTATESSETISKEMSDVNEGEVGSGDEENKEPKVLDATVDVESSTGGTEKGACDIAEGTVAVGGETNGSG